MKKVLLICLSMLLVCGCGNVKLKDGENAIVTFKDAEGISSDSLYKELKKNYGIDHLLTLIDTELLDKEYKETAEEKAYINQVLKSVKQEAGDKFLDQIKYYYNVNSEKEFKEYIRLNYRRTLYIEDYAKKNVTDKAIKEYYEKKYVGNMDLSHILIQSEATNEMSADEKKKAETAALNKAKDVIKELNDGAKFEDLAKKYSKDEANKNDGGKLGTVNYGMNYDEDFVNGAVKVKEGSYSKEPVKTQFGYHIIFKNKQEKKPELKDCEDTIREILANETLKKDKDIYGKALENLRESNGMKIKDKELKKAYDDYLNKTKEQSKY